MVLIRFQGDGLLQVLNGLRVFFLADPLHRAVVVQNISGIHGRLPIERFLEIGLGGLVISELPQSIAAHDVDPDDLFLGEARRQAVFGLGILPEPEIAQRQIIASPEVVGLELQGSVELRHRLVGFPLLVTVIACQVVVERRLQRVFRSLVAFFLGSGLITGLGQVASTAEMERTGRVTELGRAVQNTQRFLSLPLLLVNRLAGQLLGHRFGEGEQQFVTPLGDLLRFRFAEGGAQNPFLITGGGESNQRKGRPDLFACCLQVLARAFAAGERRLEDGVVTVLNESFVFFAGGQSSLDLFPGAVRVVLEILQAPF